jgi:dihydropteroate synthase
VVIKEPVVMGIINTTPDSFYSGSRISYGDAALQKAEQMLTEGALILDIGGQSTRPGSIRIEKEEELKRVVPVIEAIHKRFPEALISIDTFYAKVAREAVNAGAGIINDVSGGNLDPDLLPTVAELKVPYVLMHMPGTPQTMQEQATYHQVTLEVFDYLNFTIQKLHERGISDIIVDPGFGFGKTTQYNFQLLDELSFFKKLQKPLLVGLSRKASIYKTLHIRAEEALNGTTVMNTVALMNGAHILRVHDVKEAVEAVRLVLAMRGSQ